MTNLTSEQIRQLNSYSVYVTPTAHPLFTLRDLLMDEKTDDCLNAVQAVSGCPNSTVTASFIMRRIGMFLSMQLFNLVAYEEVWDGEDSGVVFGAIEEYGNKTVSLYLKECDWHLVEEDEHAIAIRKILLQTDTIIRQLRTVSSVSPLTLWENVFGFLLWQYHVLLDNPATSKEARLDLDILKNDQTWAGIAQRSLFAVYLNDREPSDMLNMTVRKTCCFSKDVPGLMQCGFCPLK
ncbi:hypothetical protein H9649_12870 [Sporosarcina sp. Sa2YVA2]|uniref:Fe-S oxidoreductase n=2 Tax=Sporosarcina quadrami TaxID=2762234 RepID=A0ABR8UBV2_9BACL|nr:hypothetical protein [Sporosarcina quadrami]